MPTTTTPGSQAGYCLGTGEVCPVCDPAATAAYKAIRRYRRQQGECNQLAKDSYKQAKDSYQLAKDSRVRKENSVLFVFISDNISYTVTVSQLHINHLI